MPVQLSTNAIIVTGVTQQAMAYDICKRILWLKHIRNLIDVTQR